MQNWTNSSFCSIFDNEVTLGWTADNFTINTTSFKNKTKQNKTNKAKQNESRKQNQSTGKSSIWSTTIIPHWRRQPNLPIWRLLVQHISAQSPKFKGQNLILQIVANLHQNIYNTYHKDQSTRNVSHPIIYIKAINLDGITVFLRGPKKRE